MPPATEGPDGPRATPTAQDHIVEETVRFIHALRNAGVDVPANTALTATHALITTGLADPDRARAGLRAVLTAHPEDIPVYDRLFPEYWRRLHQLLDPDTPTHPDEPENTPEGALNPLTPDDPLAHPNEDPHDPPDHDDAHPTPTTDSTTDPTPPTDPHAPSEPETVRTAVYSPTGRSTLVDIPPTTLTEDTHTTRAVDRLTTALASLPGRRWEPGDRERVDTRRALRQSFSTGGTMLAVPHKDRKHTSVDAVILVDVSRSVLDTIDRPFLIEFLRTLTTRWRAVRVFFFDTDLREVTTAFNADTPHAALTALQTAEAEWGGGTRIGQAIHTIQREHPDAVGRTTIALVISDGLEVGEITLLENTMAWLSARARGVLWLNPLAAAPEYQPTCRGMAASLPYVNGVFPFTGPDDITELARQIEQHGLTGRIGYEFHPARNP